MGTYHKNRPDVIEGDDIIELLGVSLAEEDGKKVALLKVALDPGKDYGAGPDGIYLHQTNGIQPKMHGPVVPAEAQASLISVLDTSPFTEEVSVELSETTAPSGESGEITTPPGTGAEGSGEQSKTSTSSKGKGK